MRKKIVLLFLILSMFFLSSCGLFGNNEVINKFDEVEDILESLFGEGGEYNIITNDIDLPSTLKEISLTWTSDKPDFLANDGKVIRGEDDVEVTLSYVLTCEGKSRKGTFIVTVKGNKVIKNSYTISFDSKGGSRVANITAEEGSVITKPVNPTRDGYKFIGWFEDELTNVEYEFIAMPQRNINLYARWKEINIEEEFFGIYNKSYSQMSVIEISSKLSNQISTAILYLDTQRYITKLSGKYTSLGDYDNFTWYMDGFTYEYIKRSDRISANYYKSDPRHLHDVAHASSAGLVITLPYFIQNGGILFGNQVYYEVTFDYDENYYLLSLELDNSNFCFKYYIVDGKINKIITDNPYDIEAKIFYENSQNTPDIYELIDYTFTRNYIVNYIFPDEVSEKSRPTIELTEPNIYIPSGMSRIDPNCIEGFYLDIEHTQKLLIEHTMILEDDLNIYIKLKNNEKYLYEFSINNESLGKIIGSGEYYEGEYVEVIFEFNDELFHIREDLYEQLKTNIKNHGFSINSSSYGSSVGVEFYAKPENTKIILIFYVDSSE